MEVEEKNQNKTKAKNPNKYKMQETLTVNLVYVMLFVPGSVGQL